MLRQQQPRLHKSGLSAFDQFIHPVAKVRFGLLWVGGVVNTTLAELASSRQQACCTGKRMLHEQ
jgi:hypothetical protein